MPTQRKRTFWTALEGMVSKKECMATSSNNMWFCPDEGTSLTLGVHLFETRSEANEKAHQYLDRIQGIVNSKRRELLDRTLPSHIVNQLG